MLKSLNFSRVAVAIAAPFFLGSLLIMGIKTRLVFAAPAEPIPGASQGKPAEPSPIPAADLINAQDLVKILQSPKGERPLLIYVGFRFPYTQAHLPGSEYMVRPPTKQWCSSCASEWKGSPEADSSLFIVDAAPGAIART